MRAGDCSSALACGVKLILGPSLSAMFTRAGELNWGQCIFLSLFSLGHGHIPMLPHRMSDYELIGLYAYDGRHALP